MLTLDPDEQTWLDDYRKALREQHPDAVRRMVVYGSKARGDAREDSDLDILLLVADEAADLQRRLRRIGYHLAAATPIAPSIMAYTEGAWETQKNRGFPFQLAVERDAVSVL